MKKVLAIDMGATSIRGIVGCVDQGRLATWEVMRMPHQMVRDQGRLRWQWEALLGKVGETICQNRADIVSVGIDTWGVDFGLVGQEGSLVAAPISYRDPENEKGFQKAMEKMGPRDIFQKTGNQVMPINTLFQLVALKEFYQEEWEKAKRVLLMPDLFNYMLSGKESAEETILSTTQLLDLGKVALSQEILDAYGIGRDMFPPVVKAGTVLGTTRTGRIKALEDLDLAVVSVCGHDTASAALMTEAYKDENCLFLSCGTWSLLGGLTRGPVLSQEAFENALTNELGYGSRNMFFKNITGLYLLEKFREQMGDRLGKAPGFGQISDYVAGDRAPFGTIDVEEPQFGAQDLDAKAAISQYLEKTGQPLPKEDMGYFKVIYESLVQKYIETIHGVEQASKKSYHALHIIGGGAKSPFLCQLIADRTGLPVTAGPFEATALGNIITQLVAMGELASIDQGIRLAGRSAQKAKYEPSGSKQE